MIRWIVGPLLLLGLTGCSGAPRMSDPDSARTVLQTVLEQWQSGGTSTSLLEGSPSVHVADYRWEAGFKLTKYKIAESSATSGFDRRYPVELWLTTPKGKPARETAIYNVATTPSLTVVRDPES